MKQTIDTNFQKKEFINRMSQSERLKKGVKLWASYYRCYPHKFAEEYLGLSLKPFQKNLLYCMNHYNYVCFYASRGLSKTWLTALYCVIRCILYPGTKIVVAGGRKAEAMKMVTEKIPELVNKSRTRMLEREIKGGLEKGIKTNMNTDAPNVTFVNGSWIKIVAANEGARSGRANILILDEFALIDENIYRSVLRRFLATSRQPGYLDKIAEKDKQKYLERNHEIFLTSCSYTYNWSYSRYKVFLEKMLEGKNYFVCGLPYQFAIKENLTNKEQLLDELSESDHNIVSWSMEMDCLFFGASDKAFFSSEDLSAIRKISKPIYPKPYYNLLKNKNFKYTEKTKREIRILTCDLALLGGKKNDSSVYALIQLVPQYTKEKHIFKGYQREIRYMEAYVGIHSELQAIRIRQLYDDLDCDYIVMDRNGNGMSIYDNLCKNLYDQERDVSYQAFISMNDVELQKRSLVEGAEKKIYTVAVESTELNSQIAYLLKNDITKGKLKLLVNINESYDYLSKFKDFITQEAEVSAKLQAPYYQTDELINEMVLLEPEYIKDNQVRLKTKGTRRKDRYSSISYGNYFANELERKILKKGKKTNIQDYCKTNTLGNQQINNNRSPFGNNFKNPFGNSMNRRVF